ncbi:MAG: FecR domain-containing protein [Candidatus Aminicenantes bacterium]|nr:FecR domain-containing protein [Candidatus Aminicenantes bacterium]
MRKKGFAAVFGMGLLLTVWAAAAAEPYQVVNGPKDFYFGHISLVEIKNDGQDPVVLREGAAKPELALLNTPIGPGDTVQTSGRRVEIQLDNGTILRLDANSELKVETILAQSLSSGQKLTNLVLRRGRLYAMYKQFSAKETFQVITTTAAVKFRTDTVAVVERAEEGGTSVQVKSGRAFVLYGPTPNDLQERQVGKKERITVAPDHGISLEEYATGSDFERWNDEVNADFVDLHRGLTPLPKPVRRLPKAVVYWAERYGDMYGEWVWDEYLGYVWRPYYNDRYPGGSWAPYYHGQWARVGGQMFWIPSEPWGWVPYHLGVWHWSPKRGWMWVPGSAFAPAWVDWGFMYGGLYAWRPWSLFDWMWWDAMGYSHGWMGSYWGSPFYWWRWMGGYSDYGFYGSNNFGEGTPFAPSAKPALGQVSKDQLKKPAAPFAMPKELYKGYRALMAGLRKGDSAVVESLRTSTRTGAVVRGEDLHAPRVHERAIGVRSFVEAVEPMRHSPALRPILGLPAPVTADASRLAARTLGRNLEPRPSEAVSAAQGRVLPRALRSSLPEPAMRVRDWNPDVSVARKLGVSIRYLSRSNEIYSPELNLSSSASGRHVRLGSGASGSSGSGYTGSSSGTSSGGSVSSGGGSASGGGSSSSTSSSSGGGHIK